MKRKLLSLVLILICFFTIMILNSIKSTTNPKLESKSELTEIICPPRCWISDAS